MWRIRQGKVLRIRPFAPPDGITHPHLHRVRAVLQVRHCHGPRKVTGGDLWLQHNTARAQIDRVEVVTHLTRLVAQMLGVARSELAPLAFSPAFDVAVV